jgi:NAD(P)-dependent dehydrogenase (short-subunit alcohol dehydrogenase family)
MEIAGKVIIMTGASEGNGKQLASRSKEWKQQMLS